MNECADAEEVNAFYHRHRRSFDYNFMIITSLAVTLIYIISDDQRGSLYSLFVAVFRLGL